MNRTATVLNIGMQITANLAIVFEPFLPFSADKIKQLINEPDLKWAQLGQIDLLKTGHHLNQPELLFEKIEDETIEKQVQKLLDTKKTNERKEYRAKPQKTNVGFDDFTRLDIRVGKIRECLKVPKADKLLQFKIDDGLGGRTILSGIAEHYNPEDLVGKQICFIANLEPRKIRGIESQGMILSAQDADGGLIVVQPSKEVLPGSEVL
jgi:methionyl-tRNA synthetase